MKKEHPIDLDLELDDEIIDAFDDVEGEEEPIKNPKRKFTYLR